MRVIAVYVDQLHGELDELHRQLNARRGAYGSSLSTVKLTAQAFKQFEKSVDLIDGKVLSRRNDRLHGFPGLFTDMLLTVILTIITYYYQFSIPHSLFHSRFETFLFCKSFPLQPFLFFFRTERYVIPETVTFEHIRFYFFCFTLFSCRFRAVD